MKRTSVILTGVVTLGLTLVLGTGVWAQATPRTPAPTAPAARPVTLPIRLVNLAYVVKNYKRTESLRKGLTDYAKKWEDEIKKLNEELEQRKAQYQDPKNAEYKEGLEKAIKKLQRETIPEKTDEARQAIGKREGEMITLIYNELEDAVTRYAQSQGFELVLHFNEVPPTEPSRTNPQYIVQRMGAMALVPMYRVQGLDISAEIVQILNDKYLSTAAAPPTAGQAPGDRR